MTLKWTKRALNQLNAAQTYIAEDNPLTALAVTKRTWDDLSYSVYIFQVFGLTLAELITGLQVEPIRWTRAKVLC